MGKHDTPKYGLIYHSSLIGQATGRNKGKIARMLSAKTALGLRVDALDEELDEKDEEERIAMGMTSRIKLENHLRKLEGKAPLPRGTNVDPSGNIAAPGQFTLKETRRYNTDADGVTEEANGETPKKELKKLRKADEGSTPSKAAVVETVTVEKKKKRKHDSDDEDEVVEKKEKKQKKKKRQSTD